jgi:cation diffusion facilitator CzcD-associated flavoprotein CzcO
MTTAASPLPHSADVVVIGGGQAALAVAYYLLREVQRAGGTLVLVDDRDAPGGAWPAAWDSLRLFSPAEFSSLPGYLLPRFLATRYPDGGTPEYPSRDDVAAYLAAYEARYELPIYRPIRARSLRSDGDQLLVQTDRGTIEARAVVSATGTARTPHIPDVPGREAFESEQLHSSAYRSPEPFRGRRVLVVGEGNSGAQIMAELAPVSQAQWACRTAPRFLPAEVDGRVLFDAATARYHALQAGAEPEKPYGLGDVVQVSPVRDALAAGLLSDVRPAPARLTASGVQWPDGTHQAFDAIVWCTGYRPTLGHLAPLLPAHSRPAVSGTRADAAPGVWLVGYGGWTGFASATLVGVGRSARQTAREVATYVWGG